MTIEYELRLGIKEHVKSREMWDEQTEKHNDARGRMIKDVDNFKKQKTIEIAEQIASYPARTLAFYNGNVHSKVSLNVEADPADDSRSKWQVVPNNLQHHMYPRTGGLVIVNTKSGYRMYPGYYENPKYIKDKCSSSMQFIYARDASTSDEINLEIKRLGFSIKDLGGWWDGVRNLQTTAVNVGKHHPYSRLFVRFVNRVVHGSGQPQNIVEYGGNSSFAIDSVEHYPEIKFK